MDRLLAAGVSLRQLLRAMTIDNAREFKLDKDLGTVEPGKRAHLLVLRQNPLLDVTAYDAIELVVMNSQVIARDTLSAKRQNSNSVLFTYRSSGCAIHGAKTWLTLG